LARIVDVSRKPKVIRIAEAEGVIKLKQDTIKMMLKGKIEKGDVVTVAKLAAINAVKHTWEIVPLCHPIPIGGVDVEVDIGEKEVKIKVKVRTIAETGVEIEALTGVAVGLIAIWDMVKKYEKNEKGAYPDTVIKEIRVIRKIKEPIYRFRQPEVSQE